MSIHIEHVSKTFGAYTALDDVNLEIKDGELMALLGPSGSGKTTLLRIVAGLEQPDEHEKCVVRFHGEDVSRRHVAERQVGFVFQHYALFKHLSVFENVAFGLRVRPRNARPSEEKIRSKVNELLKLIQLENFGNRYPSQLSGGQRQRVALARALAIEPKVLLLDEPFGALDAKVRQGLRKWLRRLHDELHMTTILVTHDQEEALEVSDRVVVMNRAKIEQVGTPSEVFHSPASEFVMDFLGNVNVFHGRVEQGQTVLGSAVEKANDAKTNGAPKVYVRPHELEISREALNGSSLTARVLRMNPAGSVAKVELALLHGGEIQVDMPFERYQELALQVGETVNVSPRRVRMFVPEYVI